MKFLKSPWAKLLFAAIVILAIFFALRILKIDFSGMSEEGFRDFVKSMGIWGPVAYVLIYIFRPLIFFPAALLSATAGIIWGTTLGFLYLQIAANLSANLEFLIARYFVREALTRRLGGKLKDLDNKIEKRGFLAVLLIRLIPNVAWDIQNFSLGITKVKYRDYFLATLIGIMPGSFALVFFGSSLIKVLFNPRNFWIIGVAILIFAGVYLLQKHLKRRRGNG